MTTSRGENTSPSHGGDKVGSPVHYYYSEENPTSDGLHLGSPHFTVGAERVMDETTQLQQVVHIPDHGTTASKDHEGGEDEEGEREEQQEHDRESLDPVPVAKQTWRFYHYAAIWIALSINVYSFMVGPSLVIETGMSWWQALLCVFVGNIISLIPLILNAYTGVKYGVPFPVVARKSFGTRGALLVAILRGLVGVGWFSFQIYIGGKALYVAATALIPQLEIHKLYLGNFLGLNLMQLICFLFFLVINGGAVLFGIEKVKHLQVVTAPLLIVAAIGLLVWSFSTVSFREVLKETEHMKKPGAAYRPLGINIMIALSSVVGTWSTMMLNITDFSRYGKSQKDQVIGQILGLPAVITVFSFIGIVATATGSIKYGNVHWDPVDLFADFPNKWISALACIVLSASILAGNITANLVSAANDWVNIYPKYISFKAAAVFSCVAGLLMMPWKLFADGTNFVMVWLVGSGGLLGAVGGILIADYWIVRYLIPPKVPANMRQDDSTSSSEVDQYCGRPLDLKFNVEHLYMGGSESVYYYTFGFNLKAFLASTLSILPGIPGFIANVGLISNKSMPSWILDIYSNGWFVSVLLSMVFYVVFSMLSHCIFERFSRGKQSHLLEDEEPSFTKQRDIAV